MPSTKCQLYFLACLLLVLTTQRLFGQSSTGSLVVTVSDPSGAVITAAELTLEDVSTGAMRTGNTGELGSHRFDILPVGTYNLRVQKSGFSSVAVQNVTVRVDTVHRQDVELQLSNVTETVNVDANLVQVITDSPALGEVIEAKRIVDLPLNNRSFLQLATLSAGVNPPNKPHGGANPSQSVAQGFSALRPTVVISVSGVRETGTEYFPIMHLTQRAPVDSLRERDRPGWT